MYLTPQDAPPALNSHWGQLLTPSSKTTAPKLTRWAYDNGVFAARFNERRFWAGLDRRYAYRDRCLFVVAPDVVANAIATMSAFRYWGCRIKEAGWPVAFAAQDGQELFDFPPEYDALFIGGSTGWKLGAGALECIKRARDAGKWVHVGRVNSNKRIAHFQIAGVDSVDGTAVTYEPAQYRRFAKQLAQRPLWVD